MMQSFKKQSSTIEQVAAEAGVSKTTVSRYINAKFEYMSDDTKKRIENVIQKLDYHPSNIARSLKSQKSRQIGCIIADISSPFSSILLKGISDICVAEGYQVLFSDVNNRPELERSCIQRFLLNQVDGLIVNTAGGNDSFLIDLKQQGIPIVLADRCIEPENELDTVTTENHHITYACMKHLKENGFQKIAFFSEENMHISTRETRRRAYCEAMEQLYGFNGNQYFYAISGENEKENQKQIKDFIRSNPGERVAVFCVNGVTLLRTLQAMQSSGFQIGEQLGICGFDDWGWASLIPPGITTITQDSYSVGVQAAKIMLKQIGSKRALAPIYRELPNQLMIRGSTTR